MTPGLLWLLIVWGALTVVLIILLIYRSTLTMQEDDQLFLDDSASAMAKDQMELMAKVNKITPVVKMLGAVSGVMILVIAGWAVYLGLNAVQPWFKCLRVAGGPVSRAAPTQTHPKEGNGPLPGFIGKDPPPCSVPPYPTDLLPSSKNSPPSGQQLRPLVLRSRLVRIETKLPVPRARPRQPFGCARPDTCAPPCTRHRPFAIVGKFDRVPRVSAQYRLVEISGRAV